MKVLGIIVEYNPFHLGHLHHLKSAVELTNADYVVAVMSGNFVQRGEPAIIDKFARTEMALKAGVDIVFEIPTIYAIQDASGFALGSIGLLNATNVVSDVVFGSESGDIDLFSKIADIILKEPSLYRQNLRRYLKKGLSFPNARRFAICDFLKGLDPNEMKRSNNILTIEYLVSLKKLNSKIKAHTIKRVGSSYNDENLTSIPSATAVRKAVLEGKKITGLPGFSSRILEREMTDGRGPIFMKDIFEIMKFKMLTSSREKMESLYGFNEGMAKRMLDNLDKPTMEEFLKAVKTKRFTLTRIKRRILYTIFDVERDFILDSNEYGPQYLRLLGFRERGRKILRIISDRSSIPLISTASKFDRSIQQRNVYVPLAKRQFDLDVKATDVYSLLFKKDNAKIHRDFKRLVIES